MDASALACVIHVWLGRFAAPGRRARKVSGLFFTFAWRRSSIWARRFECADAYASAVGASGLTRAVGRHFDKVDLALSDSADRAASYRPPWPLRARSTRAINSRGLKGLVR